MRLPLIALLLAGCGAKSVDPGGVSERDSGASRDAGTCAGGATFILGREDDGPGCRSALRRDCALEYWLSLTGPGGVALLLQENQCETGCDSYGCMDCDYRLFEPFTDPITFEWDGTYFANAAECIGEEGCARAGRHEVRMCALPDLVGDGSCDQGGMGPAVCTTVAFDLPAAEPIRGTVDLR